MCTLFANIYVLLTWSPHVVYHGDPICFSWSDLHYPKNIYIIEKTVHMFTHTCTKPSTSLSLTNDFTILYLTLDNLVLYTIRDMHLHRYSTDFIISYSSQYMLRIVTVTARMPEVHFRICRTTSTKIEGSREHILL